MIADALCVNSVVGVMVYLAAHSHFNSAISDQCYIAKQVRHVLRMFVRFALCTPAVCRCAITVAEDGYAYSHELAITHGSREHHGWRLLYSASTRVGGIMEIQRRSVVGRYRVNIRRAITSGPCFTSYLSSFHRQNTIVHLCRPTLTGEQ